MIRAAVFSLLFVASAYGDDTKDIVYSVSAGEVGVEIFVPAKVKPVRALLLHASDYKTKRSERYDEFCRQARIAHVSMSFPNGGKYANRDERLLKALRAVLKEFAEQHERPEVVNVPWLAIGNSSYWRSYGLLHLQPEKAIGYCVLAGAVIDPAKLTPSQAAIPVLYSFGGKEDRHNQLDTIEKFYEPARKQGLPWTLALCWDCGFIQRNATTLALPWLHALLDARLPAEAPADGMVKLKEINQEDNWLGDRARDFAPAIAPYADYRDEKERAVWLPNKQVAHIWQAYQAKDSPVVVSAQASYEHWYLPGYDPEREFEMSIYPIHSLTLGVRVKKGTTLKRVQWYDGDQMIAEGVKPRLQYRWDKLARGYHVLYAHWETEDGTRGVTFPGFVSVKWEYPEKK